VNSLHQVLKNETKILHQEAEKSLKAELLFSPALKQADLIEHLELQAEAHQSLKTALLPFQESSFLAPFWPLEDFAELAQQDLKSFEVKSAPRSPINRFKNKFQALGALYVINGSTLGRRHIGNALKPKIMQWQLKPLFFYPAASNKGINWPKFCEKLNALKLSDESLVEVIEGAKKTFSVFIKQAS
jgi:heme oxygenase